MKTKLHILNAQSWLFIELAIITIVAWAVLDPAVVNLYYRLLPLGYDSGQLLYAETNVGTEIEYDEEGKTLGPYDITEKRQEQMLRQLSNVEGVASVYLYDDNRGSVGYDKLAYTGDTTYVANVNFVPYANFFETYGLHPLPGSPSAEQLSHLRKQDRQVVLTRSAAITLFGTTDVVGRKFTILHQDPGEGGVTVAGVVEDFRKYVASTLYTMVITPLELKSTNCKYIIRLQEGINVRRFLEENGRDLIRSGKTGFNRISRLITFEDWLRQMELDAGRAQEVNRSLALALFFLVNLVLAVVGTVWLHAKRRTEECGVQRAFGATRRRVLFDFLRQNALLATVAATVGIVIYLNYAYSGLDEYDGFEYCETLYHNTRDILQPTDFRWPDRFWPHFLVVTGIVYFIILITTLIGTAIPAMKIIGTKITDAIKEE